MSAQVLPITQPGWVYILSNVAMPGLLKVGQTTRSPEERALELATTGVPTPFEVEVAWPVDDVREAERQAHAALDRFRVSDSREWFRVSVPEALNVLGRARDRQKWSAWWLVRGIAEAVGWLTIAALVIAPFLGGGQ
jgi:hypothetical protein